MKLGISTLMAAGVFSAVCATVKTVEVAHVVDSTDRTCQSLPFQRLCLELTSASDDLTPLALWGAYVGPTTYKIPSTADQIAVPRCGWSSLHVAFRPAGRSLYTFSARQIPPTAATLNENERLLAVTTIDPSRVSEWAARIMLMLKVTATAVGKTVCWSKGS